MSHTGKTLGFVISRFLVLSLFAVGILLLRQIPF
jgi:hypothetical protein